MNTSTTLSALIADTLSSKDNTVSTLAADRDTLDALELAIGHAGSDEITSEKDLAEVLAVAQELTELVMLHDGFLTLESADKEERLSKISELVGSAYTEESASTFIKEARRVVVQIIAKILDATARWFSAWANGTNLRVRALKKAADQLRLKLNAGEKEVTVPSYANGAIPRTLFDEGDMTVSVANGTVTIDVLVALIQVVDNAYGTVLKKAGNIDDYRQGLAEVIKVLNKNIQSEATDYNLFTASTKLPIGISSLAGNDNDADFLLLPTLVTVKSDASSINAKTVPIVDELDALENMIKVIEKHVTLYGGTKSSLPIVKAASSAVDKSEDEALIKLINEDVPRYVAFVKLVADIVGETMADTGRLLMDQLK